VLDIIETTAFTQFTSRNWALQHNKMLYLRLPRTYWNNR